MTRFARLAGSFALAALLAACATSRPGPESAPSPFEAGAGVSDEVLLTVENNDFRDASIYALWNGVRKRVGSVTGKTSETFRMQWQSEEIQLQVDFLGSNSDDYISERVPVIQGDHLNFVIMGF